MALIKVASRSPISHVFSILENGRPKDYIIKGTNHNQIRSVSGVEAEHPHITQIEAEVFQKIKEKYASHLKLFGGTTSDGIKHDAQIYEAKTIDEATKIMKDSEPIITDKEMHTKTKGIEPYKPDIAK